MADFDFDFDYHVASQYHMTASDNKKAMSDPIHISLSDAVYIGQDNEPSNQQLLAAGYVQADVEEDEEDDDCDHYFYEPVDLLPPTNFNSSQFDTLPDNNGFHTSVGEFDQRWEDDLFIDPSSLLNQYPGVAAAPHSNASALELTSTTPSQDPSISHRSPTQSLPLLADPLEVHLRAPPKGMPLEHVEPPQIPVPSPDSRLIPQEASALVATPRAAPLVTPATRSDSDSTNFAEDETDEDYSPDEDGSFESVSRQSVRGRLKPRRVPLKKLPRREKYVCTMVNPDGGRCSKTFGRPYDLERHLDIHNPNRRTHFCKYCPGQDKLFSRADALTRHIKNKHGREE